LSDFDQRLPAKQRDRLITRACARNLPVEVTLVGRQEPAALKSRMLKAGKAGAGPLVIESPTLSGRRVHVYPNETVAVVLRFGGERYRFRSKVENTGRMKLGGNVDVGILGLTYPGEFVKLQRRNHYRVTLSALQPLTVNCIARNPRRDGAEGAPGDYLRFDASAVDISAGGLGLRLPRQYAWIAAQGRRMALLFPLPGFAEPVRLLGEVRHTRQAVKTGEKVAGIQFVDWDRTLSGRRAINHIARFVTRKQREELKKKSGLE